MDIHHDFYMVEFDGRGRQEQSHTRRAMDD
jgi:hypothetical protein